MKFVIVSIVLISALFLNYSCTEEVNSSLSSEKVLFYVAYQNNAWGYRFHGWFVDNQGNIWNLEAPIKWWDKEMTIEGSQGPYWIDKDSLYREYSSKADGIIHQISQEELAEGLLLESKIKHISYSTPQNVMADAGQTLYGYLKFDPEKKAFRQIPLATEGDWEYHINDEKAIALKEWLFDIAVEISEKQK